MKNWTLRQRILASFAVIIAIMLLMVVVSYSRLLKIEDSEENVRVDAVPGVYYSSMIRGGWVDSYVLTQQIVGLSGNREITAEDKARYQGFEQHLREEMQNYQKLIQNPADQASFDEFEANHLAFNQAMAKVLDLYQRKDYEGARQALDKELTPEWIGGRGHLNHIIERNRELAENATQTIGDAVTAAKVAMGLSFLVALIVAVLCGLLLMRAIMGPMNRIVEILEIMRSGDLSGRLNLARKDEFGAVETGFNDMMAELTSLVSQAQRSSVQVTTSVTEIAATSRQQQATATETAATTTEIGATSWKSPPPPETWCAP